MNICSCRKNLFDFAGTCKILDSFSAEVDVHAVSFLSNELANILDIFRYFPCLCCYTGLFDIWVSHNT